MDDTYQHSLSMNVGGRWCEKEDRKEILFPDLEYLISSKKQRQKEKEIENIAKKNRERRRR